MRILLASTLILGASALVLLAPNAGITQDKKDVTLTGKITCAKCELKIEKKCATVIVVKDTVYYFDKASHEKNHEGVCTEPRKGTVEATIVDDGKKKIISVKKITFE